MDYDGKCSHLHGHSYLWEVTIKGGLTDNGMVIDFKDLKKIMEQVIEPYDHALVLRGDDPFVEFVPLATNGERQRLILLSENPTAENMALTVGRHIQFELVMRPEHKHLSVTNVRVWETVSSCAECSGADIVSGKGVFNVK